MTKLEHWKKIAAEATPGPWEVNEDGIRCAYPSRRDPQWKDWIGLKMSNMPLVGQRELNAEFIAASREAVPVLIDCLEMAIKGMEYSSEKMGFFETRDTSPQASAWFHLNNVIREVRKKLEEK